MYASDAKKRGFTLVELLVVISIIGILMGLLVPAVQYSREAGRRASCQNNLKNQALALHHFHDAHRRFPPGRDAVLGLDHSWATYLLPYLEQSPLYSQIDLAKRWDDPGGNELVTRAALSVFRCPSSILEYPGDSDYGGIMGSGMTGADWNRAFRNGVLVEVSQHASAFVSMAHVTDGLSSTICIGESSDNRDFEHGRWADGLNIFAHGDETSVNISRSSLFSRHTGGAFAARADGGVFYLPRNTDSYVIGALCTRDEGEVIDTSGF